MERRASPKRRAGSPSQRETRATETPANERAPTPLANRVPRHVALKLAGFTVALFALPLLVYFASRDYVFNGDAIYAAFSAALSANVVLVAYVIVAFYEDAGAAPSDKKAR